MRDAGAVRRWGRVVVALLLPLALVGPFGIRQPLLAAATVNVSIENFAFIGPNGTDGNFTIPVNTTVVWTNRDPFTHTVMHDVPTPLFDSGNLAMNDTFSFTFVQPGVFPYHCMIHSSTPTMHGTITVIAAPTVTSVTPAMGPMAGGTAVTISGADFQNGATVAFGGVPAMSVAFVNSGTLTAVTPRHAAGTVDVVVTNPDFGVGTGGGVYTYVVINPLPPPKPQGSPTSGNPAPAPALRPQVPVDPGGPPAPLPTHR